MKFSYVTIFAVSASFASAAYTTSDIPSCAIPCFESGAPQVGCTVTDQTCQCAKASELTDKITGCVTDVCSIEDALSKLLVFQAAQSTC
ncbi:cfem domain-containing protein [Neofusicoccum parvum]|uniref:Cfem domain-containing protein n=2 Tax=Neofusicoccum parvum TaxID=310453 RepID=A0ACB5SQM9_9PEZI|nr:putative mac1 interacting protein 1 protein [Neofusicoccum parvum UCRNP2]GME52493.1 cfem domain-containing protein [Neofusicoccum parvum]GME65486.1 cfem domain-containing protein [Neofusicoccum parvum]